MKRMIYTWLYGLSIVSLMTFFVGCREEVIELQQDELTQVPVKIIATHAAPIVDSRLDYTDVEDATQSMQVVWGNTDKIKVFVEKPSSDEWSTSYMAIADGAGTKQATFAGYFPKNTADGATIWAFYPITAELPMSKPGLEIDLHRMITDYGETSELMYYDYMVAKGIYEKNAEEDEVGGTVVLDFEHKVSMLRLELTIPTTAVSMPIHEIKVESEDLLSKGSLMFGKDQLYAPTVGEDERNKQYVQFNSKGKPVTSTSESTTITAYMAVMPTTLDAPLTVSAQVGGDVYSAVITLTSKPVLKAGVRYALRVSLDDALKADYDWYRSPETDGSFLLKDEGDLRGFSNITNGYHLPSDIPQTDFKGREVKLGGNVALKADWLPVANSAGFSGTFDGQGYTISNLQIDKENLTAQGFFSTLSGGAVVKNLTIDGGRVVCYDAGGGIVGLLMQSRVINCINKADISIISQAAVFDELTKERQDPSVGGIVGFSLQGVVVGCVNYGKIKSVSEASSGGIVGFNYPFNFKDESIGATDAGGYVMACANHGTIIGGKISAGIIGFNKDDSHGAIGCFNSYARSEYAISNILSAGNGCFVIADNKEDFRDKEHLSFTTREALNSTDYATMNEAIVEHNKKFGLSSMFYCPYQWKTGAEWPVVEKIGGVGGSTGDYGDGGKLGN